MKRQKKNYVLIALIVLLLAIAVGYAAFQTVLTISGTAQSDANAWEVKFTNVTTSNSDQVDVDLTDEKTITVAADLLYPGDAYTVTATIANTGKTDAKLTSLVSSLTSDPDVEISLPSIQGEELDAGDTCDVTFVIKWKTTSAADQLATKNFTITFTYDQNTTESNLTPDHNHTANSAS